MTVLKNALQQGQFVCILEFVPKPSAQRFAQVAAMMARGGFCGWPLTVSIGDRVGSALDLSPLDAYDCLPEPVPALLHFSGKDRERSELLAQLQRMDAAGLAQMLVLTGDRLHGHVPGQRPVRYLESVAALGIIRQARPDWLLGAALNPFKYREEEGGAQYFKAAKKLKAGADFLDLQLGFDMDKHVEALDWMQRQPQPRPLIACLLALTVGRAKMLGQVAGVTVSASMLAMLEAEAAVSKAFAQARSVGRLALQIVELQRLGYAGVHLSGLHEAQQMDALEAAVQACQAQIRTPAAWQTAWNEAWHMPGCAPVTFHPEQANWRQGQSHVQPSWREAARVKLLGGLHHQLFSASTPLGRGFAWAVRRPFWQGRRGARWLHWLERRAKRPLVGCDTCGSCRLEQTVYICPETCPKGLANGPCGGTQLNRCEFGDRECIHSVRYRTAKADPQAALASQALIDCVNVETRHRSSWPQWFDANRPGEPR
ncbi:methylenetetrahydrofolate reductase C-terminal domain-containing protein [Pseudomonas cremoricolorata]|uniref:Methylenetetrahydrofolate reductase n=1 Tax=Pseudomonas cremoricolorata TaxID=157783 RepID=A0A089WRN1_9PSED|nr:methylenetetrahydrofolate reductase C-terminal domain-containing protein [Pseudomonas cremoricolorata]AIR91251.1 methylenetetrahydrofolate reductase [Pseudomonas cremoricolorata]